MTPPKVALIACGAFNPLTNMHLRMFELGRDHLQNRCNQNVVCGVVSPVHDTYKKKDLIESSHRCEMLSLALENNDWIRLSTWECQQDSWTRTRRVLEQHQNWLNQVVNDLKDSPNKRQRREDTGWIPNNLKCHGDGPIQVKLLCGADLLESFAEQKNWKDEDIVAIVGQFGLVVITREGSNPTRFIYESDILTKYQNNITIVTEWIMNDVSSTKVRRSLRRNESVKYLIPDQVIDYIKKNSLYGTQDNKYLYPTSTHQQHYFLTPSPSDVNMESPSPTAQFDFTQNARNLEDTFVMPLVGPKISLSYLNVNDVDGKVAASKDQKTSMISYPGQAVQIIRTASGENEVYNDGKVSTDAKEPPVVANVQIQITKDGIKVISDKETTV